MTLLLSGNYCYSNNSHSIRNLHTKSELHLTDEARFLVPYFLTSLLLTSSLERLHIAEFFVISIEGYKVVVFATFHYFAFVHHAYLVGTFDGR